MRTNNLVVVGASLTGLRSVEVARKARFEGAITLVGAEAHPPCDRPPLSKAFLDRSASGSVPVPPTLRTESALRDELGVRLVLGSPATALDTKAREIVVGDRPLPYDAMVIATGARSRTLPGTEHLAGVLTLRTLEDATPHTRGAGTRSADGGDRSGLHRLRSRFGRTETWPRRDGDRRHAHTAGTGGWRGDGRSLRFAAPAQRNGPPVRHRRQSDRGPRPRRAGGADRRHGSARRPGGGRHRSRSLGRLARRLGPAARGRRRM